MRKLNEFLGYLSVGVGMAFATCSFMMMGLLFAQGSPSKVLVSMGLASVICIVISMSVAELASMFPSSPGIRTYLKLALGDSPSLFMVYLYLAFLILVAGVESYVLTLVIKEVTPTLNTCTLIFAVLGLVTAVNLAGLEAPRGFQMLITGFLVLIVGAIGLYSLLVPAAVATRNVWVTPIQTTWAGSLPGMVGMAIFLFIGFEWITPMGRSQASYRILIPFAMPASILTNAVSNGIFVAGMALSMVQGDIEGTPIPHVRYLVNLFGSPGIQFALLVSVLASLSTFNAGLMGGSRFLYALSREGKLPRFFQRIRENNGVPVASVAFLSAMSVSSSLAVLFLNLEKVFSIIGSAIICMVYGALMYSALRLRNLRPNQARSFRSPVPVVAQWIFAAALPALGILTLVSEVSLGWEPLFGFSGFCAMAFILTWLSQKGKGPATRPLERPAELTDLIVVPNRSGPTSEGTQS